VRQWCDSNGFPACGSHNSTLSWTTSSSSSFFFIIFLLLVESVGDPLCVKTHIVDRQVILRSPRRFFSVRYLICIDFPSWYFQWSNFIIIIVFSSSSLSVLVLVSRKSEAYFSARLHLVCVCLCGGFSGYSSESTKLQFRVCFPLCGTLLNSVWYCFIFTVSVSFLLQQSGQWTRLRLRCVYASTDIYSSNCHTLLIDRCLISSFSVHICLVSL